MLRKLMLLCLSLGACQAFATDAGGYLSLRSVFAEASFAGEKEGGVGAGMVLGYRSGGAFIEYDYSAVTGFELILDPDFFFGGASQPFILDDDFDIDSHNAFVGYRTGGWVYAEFKLGHSYQRIKESGGEKRVLDEVNRQAAGIELGLRSRVAGLGLQYQWLGDDYEQLSLALRFYF